MAIKCFKQVDGDKTYINSKHICCVRECYDGEIAIDTIDGNTTYTNQSIESIVRWWRKQQEDKVKDKLSDDFEKKYNDYKKIDEVFEVVLYKINDARPCVVKALKKVLNFHLEEVRDLCENSSLTVLTTRDKKEAVEVWSNLKKELSNTTVMIDLHEYISRW